MGISDCRLWIMYVGRGRRRFDFACSRAYHETMKRTMVLVAFLALVGIVLAATPEAWPAVPRSRRAAPLRSPLVPAAMPVPADVPDSLVWQLVGRVSLDSLETTLLRLRAFGTRYCTEESCRSAVNWLGGRFADYACDSVYQDTFVSSYAPNVIGIKRGSVHPQRVYVVCAHVDDYSETPYTIAPGSDDNGSGVGLVGEVARVFSDMAFESTVLFVGFSAEEEGLIGSDSFAHQARLRGDTIAAAFNFDMISYGRQNLDSIRFVYASFMPASETLAGYCKAQADTYTVLKSKKFLNDAALSDHASFWEYGYLAVRGGYNDRTPMYHTTGDTIGPLYYQSCGTNNLPMYTEVVKAMVAVLAKLAGAHPLTAVAEGGPPDAVRVTRDARPNPFRSRVVIRFSPTPDPQSPTPVLGVYDATGRLVRVLQSTIVNRRSSIVWDGCDGRGAAVRPGVYFARCGSASIRMVRAPD
jgi:hypothetical protein